MLTIHHRAGEDGKLFGSVTAKEIAEAIRDARDLRIDRRKIRLEQPIHETGTYMVEIEVQGGATASVKTIVAEAEVATATAGSSPPPRSRFDARKVAENPHSARTVGRRRVVSLTGCGQASAGFAGAAAGFRRS